jgi:aryl-alcohol dehydrogenase-like predicted oxidoreductase
MLTYAHSAFLTEHIFIKGLKTAGLDYADILLLGYFSRKPSRRILDGALKLKDKGLVRFIGLTSHNRKLFPQLAEDNTLDVFHVRYSAGHRGAETETFPFLDIRQRPGVVSFTATNWGNLLKPGKMPPGEATPTAAECYRFVLSNPAVDVCMVGAKTMDQMQKNLEVLKQGPMNQEELARMRRIGDHLH